jgi:hypothetical protein
MEPIQTKRRIGLVSIGKGIWEKHSAAVRRSFADSMILDTKPNAATQSVDIVLINQKFDEVDADSTVPRYHCKLFVGDDGSVKRGDMLREESP